jgi:Zn-dependent membrane protease YugP
MPVQGSGLSFGGFGPYLLLVLVPMLLGLWAQFRVKSAFGRASQVAASSGLSGAEVAREIMRAHGISNVGVEESHGFLSDHYDPKAKMLRLSHDVFNGRSVAALGIAAHEAGHALQDATGYGPLRLRSAVVPLAMVGSNVANIALMGGLLVAAFIAPKLGLTMLLAGVAGLFLVALFQLITLPVEFDASNRAKNLLTTTGLVAPGEETSEMSSVLNAAALTYVAALVATIGTILYYLLIIFSHQRRD